MGIKFNGGVLSGNGVAVSVPKGGGADFEFNGTRISDNKIGFEERDTPGDWAISGPAPEVCQALLAYQAAKPVTEAEAEQELERSGIMKWFSGRTVKELAIAVIKHPDVIERWVKLFSGPAA